MIDSVTIELMTADMEGSVHFYRDLLNFDLIASENSEDGQMEWVLLQQNNVLLSLKADQKLRKELPFLKDVSIGGSAFLCFKVKDLTAVYERISHYCDTINHPHLTPCGKVNFSMLDINGYLLTFESDEEIS